MASSNIAIFDLDETLTKHGTWGRFVVSCVKYRPWLWLPLAISAGVTQWRYKQGHFPRIRVKQAMMKWSMVGKSRAELDARAEAFAAREVASGMRPGAIRALKAHQEAGDTVIIISAAVDLIVAPIAEKLGIPHYLATDMKWMDGRLAPDFASENCYGPNKVTRLTAFLDAHPKLKQTDTIITFYSDSYSDIDLLRFSDVGKAVHPDRRLRAAAPKEGFEILNWGQ